MDKLISYIKHSRAELAKVIFPTKEQVINAFVSVVVVVAVVAMFLALIDVIMSFTLSHIA